MSEARIFINSRTQSYQSLKASTPVSGHARDKFDVLNAHIANSVVMGGELVIVGDSDTASCTSYEAFLMANAAQVHAGLLTSGVDADDFSWSTSTYCKVFLPTLQWELVQSVTAGAGICKISRTHSRRSSNYIALTSALAP